MTTYGITADTIEFCKALEKLGLKKKSSHNIIEVLEPLQQMVTLSQDEAEKKFGKTPTLEVIRREWDVFLDNKAKENEPKEDKTERTGIGEWY